MNSSSLSLSPSVRLPSLDKVLAEIDRRRSLTEAEEAKAEAERRFHEEQGANASHESEKARCAADIVHWFNAWLWTYDPRLIGQVDPATLQRKSPYVRFQLWPKQEDFIRWLEVKVEGNEEWLLEKSRDVGATFLTAGFALHRWLFVPGFKTTFGSRKVDLVDKRDNPDAIFEKLRIMARRLPEWMMPTGFLWSTHDNYMRLTNPETGATIVGEGGDDMGRGGRSSLYVVDEAAFIERAEGVEKALSGNTDCVGWVSSVNGMGNLFARKRHSILKPGQVFRLHWRDDPRKTEAWAAQKQASFSEPTGWASEYDIDYSASLEGVCIPAAWVESAKRLLSLEPGIVPTNEAVAGGDVGAGKAKSVIVVRRGPIVSPPKSRGEPDTTETAHWMLQCCREARASLLNFDSVGVGAGVASTLKHNKVAGLTAEPVNVGDPPSERVWEDERKSEEMFGNLKAEIWWLARTAFQRTHEYVLHLEGKPGGKAHRTNELLCMPDDPNLASQLSLVKYFKNERGKIVIETKKQLTTRGIPSPDYAEAFVLTFVDRRPAYDLRNL